MVAGPDAATLDAFVDWLRARRPGVGPGDVKRGLRELAELELLDAGSEELERRLAESHDEQHADRLTLLHAAWSGFCAGREADVSDDPAATSAWVGRPSAAGPAADEITWIEAEQLTGPPLPEGTAPRLVPRGSRRPAAPQRRRGVRVGPAAILVPLLLLGACAWLVVFLARSSASLAAARRQASTVGVALDAPLPERELRLDRQASVAPLLVRLRESQAQAVLDHCEEGAWCEERLAVRESSLRLARQLQDDADGWERAPRAQPAELPARLLDADLAALDDALAHLDQSIEGLSADDAPTAVRRERLQRRRAVLEAEREVLSAAARQLGPP